MAHHDSTPQSVLDAPAFHPAPFYSSFGLTRKERRRGTGRRGLERAAAQLQGRNVPYVKRTQ